MRRAFEILGIFVALVLCSALALATSAAIHLQAPNGRRALGDLLAHWIDDEINGTIEIRHVDEVGLDRLVGRDVIFRDMRGRSVLHLEHVIIDPDLARLFSSRTIAFTSARVHGARMSLIQNDRGLTLEHAFDSPHPPGGTPSFWLAYERVHFDGLDVNWRLRGAPRFILNDAQGFMVLRTNHKGDVRMRFDRLRARVTTQGLPIDIAGELLEASGVIRANSERLSDFDLVFDIRGASTRVALTLLDPREANGVQVHAHMAVDELSLAWLVALGLDIATHVDDAPGEIELVDALGGGRLQVHRGPHGESTPERRPTGG